MQRQTSVTASDAAFVPTPVAPENYPQVAWPALARTAGRFPRSGFYDDLARLATRGRCDAAQLLEAARDGRRVKPLDARALGWFAHVTASHTENPQRFQDVAALLDMAGTGPGSKVFAPQLDDVWVQSYFLGGLLDAAARKQLRHGAAKPEVWWAVDTDEIHPGEVSADAVRWFAAFNKPFVEAGLEPVTVLPGQGHPFDRLSCEVPRLTDPDLPLVTVVVPVYNPGVSLRTAVGSLCAQSWWNLDIVLADDASTCGEEVFEEVLALDPRVRRVRAPRNAGAYGARNLGMREARGDLVTFNDADDWAHPRKIERQARALLGDPGASASISWAIRVTEDLRLTVIGRPTRRINLSSVLVRREDVLGELGGFDAVRKGADTEFVERLITVHGADAIRETKDPLSLVQLTSGSLSRDDYRFLRTHPARRQFVASFRQWHRRLAIGMAGGTESPFVAAGVRAPYPAPRVISGQPDPDVVHDVLVLTNLSPLSPTTVDLAGELAALAHAGLDVAVREELAPFDLTRSPRPPTGAYVELVNEGLITQVTTFERARAGLVIVRDPAAVIAAPDDEPGDVTTRVLVVADYSPDEGRRYVPREVEDRLRRRLAVDVTWLPSTAAIRDELIAAGCVDVLAPAPFVALGRPVAPVRRGPIRRRVAVFPGDLLRMPKADLERTVQSLTPAPEVAESLCVGPKRLSSIVDASIAQEETTVENVCVMTDVVVVGRTPGRGGHTHEAAVRALHEGCVVIADAELRPHLGQAALYLDEASVTDWLLRLVDSPDLLTTQREHGAAWAREHTSPTRLAALVSDVLDHRSEGTL